MFPSWHSQKPRLVISLPPWKQRVNKNQSLSELSVNLFFVHVTRSLVVLSFIYLTNQEARVGVHALAYVRACVWKIYRGAKCMRDRVLVCVTFHLPGAVNEPVQSALSVRFSRFIFFTPPDYKIFIFHHGSYRRVGCYSQHVISPHRDVWTMYYQQTIDMAYTHYTHSTVRLETNRLYLFYTPRAV